jgi:hypothetical protein
MDPDQTFRRVLDPDPDPIRFSKSFGSGSGFDPEYLRLLIPMILKSYGHLILIEN